MPWLQTSISFAGTRLFSRGSGSSGLGHSQERFQRSAIWSMHPPWLKDVICTLRNGARVSFVPVLRSVGREDRTRRRHLNVGEPQRPEHPVIAEDALAAAHDYRIDHQP